MDRIDALRMRLHKMWDAPLAARVKLWRDLYRDCPDSDRERMHRLAYDLKLGAATGAEWTQTPEEVIDPEGPSLPLDPPLGIDADRPYRGYGLHVIVERGSDATWSARGSVHNSDWLAIHNFALASLASIQEALRAGMSVAVAFVDGRMGPFA